MKTIPTPRQKTLSALVATLVCSAAWASPSACDATAGNLVLNCGFESNVPAWASSGQLVNMGPDGVRIHSGGGAWAFGNRNNFGRPDIYPNQGFGYLSQTLATQAGGVYEVSFWLLSAGTGPASSFPPPFSYNEFTVDWDGAQVFDLVNFNPYFSGTTNYLRYAVQVTAASASTVLRIGGFHNISAYVVDDLAVVELQPPPSHGVPEPTPLALATLSLGLLAALRQARRPGPGRITRQPLQARPRPVAQSLGR